MSHRAARNLRHRAARHGRHRGERRAPRPSRWIATAAVAVTVTGGTVAGGIVLSGPSADPDTVRLAVLSAPVPTPTPVESLTPQPTPTEVADRDQPESRSAFRNPVAPAKKVLLSQQSGGQLIRTTDLRSGDPRDVAKALLLEYGFATSTFSCLDQLWTEESNWRVNAQNRSSGAYGIPQALPGSKMASAGPDWQTNPETQIRWGLGYIKARYGDPCSALDHKHSRGWY